MMTPRSLSILTAAALLGSPAFAQVVSPEHFTNAAGNTYSYQPFGANNANGYRYLQVHDDLQGKKMTIKGVAFRRDPTATTNPAMAYSLRLTLLVSTAATTSATISSTFDSNHGANKATVIANKQIDFPATRDDTIPAPFRYVLMFDQPYSFDGTNGGLCWEVQVSQQQNLLTTVYFDFVTSSSTNPGVKVQRYGDGCIHSTRYSAAGATGSSSPNWNAKQGTLYLNGSNLPPNQLAIAVIGFSRAAFGPIPLPFIFPGSQTQYSGPCSLYASLDILIPAGVQSNGNAQAVQIVPMDASFMNGFKLYGQYLVPDSATRAGIQFISSNGVEFNFVAPYPAQPGAYCLGQSVFAPTGSTAKNQMYVTKLL